MVEVEATFEKLIGRQPSPKEIQSLYRVKNALNIRDNDALWMVLMALESYDTMYRKYPGQIASQVSQIVEQQRLVIAETADAETKRALGTLADAVARTSQSIASQVAEASRLQSWGWACIGFVAFGALCMVVGFILGTGRIPYWAIVRPGDGPVEILLGTFARTPAGWIAAIGGAAAALSAAWRSRGGGLKLRTWAAPVFLLCLSAACLIPIFW